MPELCIPEIAVVPKEKLQESVLGKRGLSISVLKSDCVASAKVPLTPMGVSALAASGLKIRLEQGAGMQSSYPDSQYSESGAEITSSKDSLMKADIVLKPSPFAADEISKAKEGQTLISPLGIARASRECIELMLRKKVVSIAMEYIQTEKGFYPISQINSEIAGRCAIFAGAGLLGKMGGGKGVLLGGVTGISPASVVIIGSGTAALHAARAAESLGAEVKIFAKSVYRLMELTQRIGKNIFTSVLQPQVLEKALQSADLLIGARGIEPQPCPIVTKEMVALMKSGSVIVDLDVETGSCIETSRPTTLQSPSFASCGVSHFCLPDITSLVPRTASIALSNVLHPLICGIYENGGINQAITFDPLLRQSVYCYSGMLTSQSLGNMLGMESKSIDLYLL